MYFLDNSAFDGGSYYSLEGSIVVFNQCSFILGRSSFMGSSSFKILI